MTSQRVESLGIHVDSTYLIRIKNTDLPSHEEEERDGGTLSEVCEPACRDRATDDDTVGIVDLGELVGSEGCRSIIDECG